MCQNSFWQAERELVGQDNCVIPQGCRPPPQGHPSALNAEEHPGVGNSLPIGQNPQSRLTLTGRTDLIPSGSEAIIETRRTRQS